jgi:uncharacterized protein YjiS (DUF1127 family)
MAPTLSLGRFARRAATGRLLDLLFAWRDRARQRRQLLALDDRLLKDIGLTRADVDIEGRKPFWIP